MKKYELRPFTAWGALFVPKDAIQADPNREYSNAILVDVHGRSPWVSTGLKLF
jgi:hypothetical protein